METKSGTSLPRILLLDIETAPIEVFAWDLHKQRIQPSNVIKDTFITAVRFTAGNMNRLWRKKCGIRQTR
jgi:hypothetical protein